MACIINRKERICEGNSGKMHVIFFYFYFLFSEKEIGHREVNVHYFVIYKGFVFRHRDIIIVSGVSP